MTRARTPDELLFAPLSPESRDAVGAIARSVEPAPVAPGLRARIVGSAERGGRFGRYADRVARMFDIPLSDAQALLTRAEDPTQFGPGPVPNATWLFVEPGPRFTGALAAIGRLEPGARVPDHAHGGTELTLVLEGGFVEDDGNEVWRGDELFKGEGSEHAFSVIGDQPCVAAVIAPGGVTFR